DRISRRSSGRRTDHSNGPSAMASQDAPANGRSYCGDQSPEPPAISLASAEAGIVQGPDLAIGKAGKADAEMAGFAADQLLGFALGHCGKIVDMAMAMIAIALLIAAAHPIPVFWARRLDFDQIEWNTIAHGGLQQIHLPHI